MAGEGWKNRDDERKVEEKIPVHTVRKMNSTLRQIELIPKMQIDIARKFQLKALHQELHTFKLCI